MEIHGLRGLAIALVIAYHLWGVGRVSGGVDIFLMISAYLMTLSFVRQGESFDTGSFLVKRFRQLLPQAALVIVATLVAAVALLPRSRLPVILDQAWASLLYYQNWVLIGLATDYNSPDRSGTSPLQHFWSLSMQGQVFVLWALTMALAVALWRAMKIPVRATLTAAFGLFTVASLIYAFRLVGIRPISAYFDTFARIWEFALASLLALAPPIRLHPRLARATGWLGVVGIVTCGLTVGRLPFPGPAALVPSLCAAAVVVAGQGDGTRSTAAYWLSTEPFRFLGDRAYGLYLWHWPIYMTWLAVTGEAAIGPVGSVVVIALSILCADLATRGVERGFNQWGVVQSWPAGLATIAAILTVTLVGVQGIRGVVATQQQKAEQQASSGLSGGARVIRPGVPIPAGEPTKNVAPGDAKIAGDWPDFPGCAPTLEPKPPAMAECGEFTPPGAPGRTIVMIGDSHAKQYMTIMRDIARDNGWRVLALIKPSCRVSQLNKWSDAACADYGRAVTSYIVETRPDLVFTVATRAMPTSPAEEPVETYNQAIAPVLDAGIRVVNLRDNPRWPFKMPECVQQFGNELGRCTRPVSEKLAPVSPLMALDPRMAQMDLTEQLCPGGVCNGVIGGTYVYMDDTHLSKAYVLTLRPEFEAQLTRVMPR